MIISKTPYRISFFGGGTDYPEWYLKEGGAVLTTTIDKYCYLSCRYFPSFFNIKHRIVWSHIETVSTISEILHPAVREGLRFLQFDDSIGLEIHHQGDLPARAGIGSSSSFSVGLIHALETLRGKKLDVRQLALKAIQLEQEVLKEHVGCQDQIAVTYGGLNAIRFSKSGDFKVEPISLPASRIAELESRLLLIYTGSTRLASEIASKVVANLHQKSQVLHQMESMVNQGIAILRNGDLDDFGRLLHEAWLLKRQLSEGISSPMIDEIYETARAKGALGGKLLGAGGTGFLVFFVPPEKKAAVLNSLSQHTHVPFKFSAEGSTVLCNGMHASSKKMNKGFLAFLERGEK